MESHSEQVTNDILRKVVLLKNFDRTVRKRALKEIKTGLLEDSSLLSEDEYSKLFSAIHVSLLTCLNDSVENCRESASEIINFVIGSIQHFDEFLPPILATLVARLTSADNPEPSEEVRLVQMQILFLIIERSNESIFRFMNDLIHILTHTILDPSPEIKRKSCTCVSVLAKKTSSKFHMVSNSLINPLLQSIYHQHSKTRRACIQALGATILHGDNKSVEDVVSHFAQRLFDHSPMVRISVVEVVGMWLLKLMDRYSFFHRLIPLHLSSLSDDVVEVRYIAKELWEKIGLQYLEENRSDYKGQMDFPLPDPKDHPDKELGRPSLGCRVLVQRHLSNILPALLRDIQDWVSETRGKSSKLLYTLLLHAEEKATINLEKILHGIILAAKDEESETVQVALKTAELLGYFIEPRLWCNSLLSSVRESPTVVHLSILSAILKGCGKKELGDYYESVCNVLADSYVCRVRKAEEQAYLLLCVEAILLLPDQVDTSVSYMLFTTLTSIAALSSDEHITEKAVCLIDTLASSQSFECSSFLYSKHIMPVLKEISSNYEIWTSFSPEVAILSFLIQSCPNMEDVACFVTPVLIKNLQPKKEAKLRSHILAVVAVMLEKLPSTTEISSDFFSLMCDGIFPNLTWQAGKTSTALRTIAIACLWKIISGKQWNEAMMAAVGDELFSKMVALAEDESPKTRLLMCRIMEYILPHLVSSVDEHKIHNLCLDFLKLMDDSSDEIRIKTTEVFKSYFTSFPSGYQWSAYNAHVKEIYKTMLIHMDDNKLEIRLSVLDLLKNAAVVCPDILLKESESAKSLCRSLDCYDTLINYIKNLHITDK